MTRRERRASVAYTRMCINYEIFLEANLFKLNRVFDSDGVQFESSGGVIEDWETKTRDIKDLVDSID